MGVSKTDGGMGYRDFGSFNKALLAKQGWRLWQSPNSFLAQIMEAKYYRGGNFLDSQLGTRPSFAWRSIHSSCELIKEGLIWSIGNGAKVRIWKDKWLPRHSTFLVQSPPRLLDLDARVCDLIDADTKWWKSDLLGNIFTQEDVRLIHFLPVSISIQEDHQVWRGTKNGFFTVKSAYYLQKELETKGAAECSTRREVYQV